MSNPKSLILETLNGFWHESFTFETFASRVEADFARTRGEKLMEHFFAWWSREPCEVIAVEKGFSVTVDDEVFTGRFDRLERTPNGIRVVDYKTSASRDQREIDADLQLSLYALAVQESFGEPCSELILLFLAEDGFVEGKTERNESQLRDARTQIRTLREGIAKGDYHPDPSVEKCRRCPYKNICNAAAIR